jgi:hypothetical protein
VATGPIRSAMIAGADCCHATSELDQLRNAVNAADQWTVLKKPRPAWLHEFDNTEEEFVGPHCELCCDQAGCRRGHARPGAALKLVALG